MRYFLTPAQTYTVLTSLIFHHCFPSLSWEETASVCNPVTCWWSLLWLMCLFLSSCRTTPPEISCVSAVDNNGQIWLSWLLTCTRTTQKTSSAAWTWRQPCMMSILCPMICAVTLPKRCWSEWEPAKKPEAFWHFYAFCLHYYIMTFIISKHIPGDFIQSLFGFLEIIQREIKIKPL